MKSFLICTMLIISYSIIAQSPSNTAKQSIGSTHIMGSGSKNVEGAGVNKDTTKYKRLENKQHSELQKEEIGNNPTSTDTIQGKNSKKVE